MGKLATVGGGAGSEPQVLPHEIDYVCVCKVDRLTGLITAAEKFAIMPVVFMRNLLAAVRVSTCIRIVNSSPTVGWRFKCRKNKLKQKLL